MALVSKILETTLAAGSTSVTFTDSDIPNSLIRVYSSDSNIIPESRILSGTSLTVVYAPQTNAIGVAVEIVKQGLDIVDDLTSTNTDKALSAKQGKTLKDLIDSIPEGKVNISDMNDVDITDIEDGQVLAWDTVTEKFVNANQSGGNITNYVTNETLIGTWIDGKNLYRQIFTGLSINLNGDNWVYYNDIDYIDSIIDMKAYFSGSYGYLNCAIAEYQRSPAGGLMMSAFSSAFNRTINVIMLIYTKSNE